ncbi:MAG: ParB/RepB/Spo0J family partition protein [Clostridia bacterium]|nr:ParB/RepB/Spo0J family partition protein [Clostridia bacterium]MDQ7792229.1 ParB/RepB/Spo0J family partition protein [Clostridia bacterium]
MSKKRALGRGLGALLPTGEDKEILKEIPVKDIRPNSRQARLVFEQGALDELAASIEEVGLVQPVVVRKVGRGYELVSGERRLRAFKQLGRTLIPALIRDMKDQEVAAAVLIENIQREDLNPLEEATAYRRLIEEHEITQEDVARRVGKSRSAVTNALRLLSLPLQVQEMVGGGLLTAGHARTLAGLENAAKQVELAQKTVAAGLSVRGLEDAVRLAGEKDSAAGGSKRTRAAIDQHLNGLAKEAARFLGTKVAIKGTPEKGRIEIRYRSAEDLERLIRALLDK